MRERALKPDTIVSGRYKIEKVLGEGGFGITYLARDMKEDKNVALKEYFPLQTAFRDMSTGEVIVYDVRIPAREDRTVSAMQPSAGDNASLDEIVGDKMLLEYNRGKDRFLKEAAILQEYRHLEGIVRVWDSFLDNNTAYIVMDYIDGITLKDYVALHGKFEYDELVEMLLPIIKSLATLHRHGLIHRDISPDNIMIGMDNGLHLIDFGAAKEVKQTKTVTVLLKAGYAPPEQYLHDGKLGAWTDVYGMCGTIYTALGGGVPVDAVARLQGKELVSLNDCGVQTCDWQWKAIEKGMRIRYAERYRNMEELLSALTVPPGMEDIVTEYGNETEEIRSIAADDTLQKDSRKKQNSLGKKISIYAGVVIVIVLIAAGIVYAVLHADNIRGYKETVSNNDTELTAGSEDASDDMNSAAEDAVSSDEYDRQVPDDEEVSGSVRLCEMPNVVGMSNADAYKAIREADGSIHIGTKRSYSENVDSGLVISQDVEPETRYNEGAISEINLIVSMGKEPDEKNSKKNSTSAKSSDNSNSEKATQKGAYDVKSDGNEKVDFYLDN